MDMIHDSESFKWSNMMNLTRWFRCRNANNKIQKMVPKSSDFKEAGGSLTLGNLFFGLWHMTVLVQYSFRSHMCANVLSINYNFGFHDSLSFVVPVIEYVSMVVKKESIINFPTFKWRNDQGINRCFFPSQINSLLYNYDVNTLVCRELFDRIWKYKTIRVQLWYPPL